MSSQKRESKTKKFFKRKSAKPEAIAEDSRANTSRESEARAQHPKRASISRRNFLKIAAVGSAGVAALALVPSLPGLLNNSTGDKSSALKYKGRVTSADRLAAALNKAVLKPARNVAYSASTIPLPTPGSTPDYFGNFSNYANSPLPTVVSARAQPTDKRLLRMGRNSWIISINTNFNKLIACIFKRVPQMQRRFNLCTRAEKSKGSRY